MLSMADISHREGVQTSRVPSGLDCTPTSQPPIYKGFGCAKPYIAHPHSLHTLDGVQPIQIWTVCKVLFAHPKPAWIKGWRVGVQTRWVGTRASLIASTQGAISRTCKSPTHRLPGCRCNPEQNDDHWRCVHSRCPDPRSLWQAEWR